MHIFFVFHIFFCVNLQKNIFKNFFKKVTKKNDSVFFSLCISQSTFLNQQKQSQKNLSLLLKKLFQFQNTTKSSILLNPHFHFSMLSFFFFIVLLKKRTIKFFIIYKKYSKKFSYFDWEIFFNWENLIFHSNNPRFWPTLLFTFLCLIFFSW